MRLVEHEVVCRHHSTGWIQRQRGAHVVTEIERRLLDVVGRSALVKVREQHHVAVGIRVAVRERPVVAIYLLAENRQTIGGLVVKNVFYIYFFYFSIKHVLCFLFFVFFYLKNIYNDLTQNHRIMT